MELEEFLKGLKGLDNDGLLDFCRKHVLHGVPYVFEGKENEFYDFRKIVSCRFEVPFHEIYITGSGKLGFSPFKRRIFDLDSDIDVAIISSSLFERVMDEICRFQMEYRKARRVVRESELEMYHEFLEYVAIGWIRPDKLPISFQMRSLKDDWFGFFNSISYGRSCVGNYKVSAGVFKSYAHLERYIVEGFKGLRTRMEVAA